MRLFAVGAIVLFVLARVVPFARAGVGLDFDSFDYLGLARRKSVIGVLGAHRPPVYLLALKLAGENRQVVTWLQLLLNVVAWIWLAFATFRTLRTRAGRIVGFAAVLVLGSCLDVGQWDRVIGTESLSIALAVMIVAATLWWWGRWSYASTVALSLLVVLWALLRDANALVVGAVGVVLLVVALLRRKTAWRTLFVVGAVAAAASVGAVVSSNVGSRWQQPMQNVVTFRVLPSPERNDYFLRRGLPVSPVDQRRIAGRCVNPVGAFLCEKVTDPAFYDWIDTRARSTYVHSWFAFPATTLWEPLAHERSIVGTRLPVAEITGTRLHESYAQALDNLVFPRSPRAVLVWMGLLAVGLAVLGSRVVRPVLVVACGLILLVYPHLWVVWTGDAVELARHGLSAALQLQLGLWLLSLGLFDALLLRFARTPDGAENRSAG
jgi:hypothetical protein